MALTTNTPRLSGWITLPEAAKILGVSNQALHKMKGLKTIRKIGYGKRPILVVAEYEIYALRNERKNITSLIDMLSNFPEDRIPTWNTPGDLSRISRESMAQRQIDYQVDYQIQQFEEARLVDNSQPIV